MNKIPEPNELCPACSASETKSSEYWLGPGGKWICRICHPPGDKKLVKDAFRYEKSNKDFVDIETVEEKKNEITNLYFLNSEEEKWCEKFGHDMYRPHPMEDGFGGWDDNEIDRVEFDIIGAKGEFGYFKLLGKNPYDHMKIKPYIGEQYDDKIYNQRIQIKSTRHKEIYMILNSKDQKTCEFAVRMQVIGNRVKAVGFLSVEEFRDKAEVDDRITKYKANPSVHESEFHPIIDLVEACKKKNNE